jgi:hypothetical protein
MSSPVLTPAQITALGAAIAANTNTVTYTISQGNPNAGQVVSLPMNQLDKSGDANNAIALWYSGFPATPFYAYYSLVPKVAIGNSVKWKKFTNPVALDATVTQQNMLLSIQLMQANVIAMLALGGTLQTLDATQTQIVQGLDDNLSAIPSNETTGTVDAGWASGSPTVQAVLNRQATNVEILFANTTNGSGANPTGTTTGPATLVFEGIVNGQSTGAINGTQVQAARGD